MHGDHYSIVIVKTCSGAITLERFKKISEHQTKANGYMQNNKKNHQINANDPNNILKTHIQINTHEQ